LSTHTEFKYSEQNTGAEQEPYFIVLECLNKSASHQAPNYVQRGQILQTMVKERKHFNVSEPERNPKITGHDDTDSHPNSKKPRNRNDMNVTCFKNTEDFKKQETNIY